MAKQKNDQHPGLWSQVKVAVVVGVVMAALGGVATYSKTLIALPGRVDDLTTKLGELTTVVDELKSVAKGLSSRYGDKIEALSDRDIDLHTQFTELKASIEVLSRLSKLAAAASPFLGVEFPESHKTTPAVPATKPYPVPPVAGYNVSDWTMSTTAETAAEQP